MGKQAKSKAREYGELLLSCPGGRWTERYHLRRDQGADLQEAWRRVKEWRLSILAAGHVVMGEKGPCDANWFPMGPATQEEEVE